MATELAKAYVQIVPSAKGIKGSISNVLGNESNNAGKLAGLNIASKLKTAIATAGIGKVLHSAISEGAALQQSLGGIDTLFKESADKVKANAQQAYKTAGMSANQYMEMVTGFSASLLQGLAGDTNKAADVADMALKDMSDNANKMGTSMDLIQNAYQGFAKQNYTMLDNLKLGYGGTKTEMQRLLADAEKLTGVEYDINNLSDVYSAIHAVQEELGITGTTALEASKTFSGSFSAMKGALKTFLGNLAIGENVVPSLRALGDTTYTFLINNFIPMVATTIGSLGQVLFTTNWAEVAQAFVTRLSEDIRSAASEILGTDTNIVDAVIDSINVGLPNLLTKAVDVITNFVTGILQNIPQIINSGSEVMAKFITCIHNNLPKVLESGVKLVLNLVNGIINNLPKIVQAGLNAVTKLFTTVMSNAPKLIQGGLELIGKLASGLIQAIPNLVAKIPTIINAIKKAFTSVNWLQLGKDIIKGIANGLINGIGSIASAARRVAENALSAMKKKMDMHSPSKRAEKEIGMMFDLGIVKGVEKNAKTVLNAVKTLGEDTINIAKRDFSYNANPMIGAGENIKALGDYIIQAILTQGAMQSEALEKGIANIHFTAKDREVMRYIESLGFVRG